MTSELGALLDGPVAERFGRPTLGVWVGHDGRVSENDWLAHLLAVCVEKNWQVKFDLSPIKIVLVVPHDGGSLVMMEKGEHMTALARAMLAVPVEVKP